MPSNPKAPFNPRPPRTSNVKEEIRKRGRSVEDYLQQAFVAAGRSWPPAPRIVAAEPSAGAHHLEHVRSIGGRGAEGGRFADPYMQEVFGGLFPVSNARDTRFAINFFTAIGLGGLHLHSALALSALAAFGAHFLERPHTAFIARAPRLNALADPHLFLREFLVELRVLFFFGLQRGLFAL